MPGYYAGQAQRKPVHRVVCDYIAGMTDQFLLRQLHRLVARPPRSGQESRARNLGAQRQDLGRAEVPTAVKFGQHRKVEET